MPIEFDAHVYTDISRQTKSQETSTMTNTNSGGSGQNHVGSQIGQDDVPGHKSEETSKSEGTQAGGTLQHSNSMASTKSTSIGTGTRSKDYNDEMVGLISLHSAKFKKKKNNRRKMLFSHKFIFQLHKQLE